MYRWKFLQGWIDRTREVVVAAKEGGFLRSDLDPMELARLIMLMTETLCDCLGRHPQEDVEPTAEVLAVSCGRILRIDPR